MAHDIPPIDAALFIIALVRSIETSNERCRNHGIGRLRRKLGPELPANVVEIRQDRAGLAKTEARDLLAALCRQCQGCDLAGE